MHSHALSTLHCPYGCVHACIDVCTIWSLKCAKLADATYEFSGTSCCNIVFVAVFKQTGSGTSIALAHTLLPLCGIWILHLVTANWSKALCMPKQT